ncbi:diguanylate cyclase [Sulfurospirillum diekertiae]|uniref:diguanylate cyclase n=1 Tax=Sulfurospirillum diekertiae TaxID=1854492 RepID=A0AA92FFR3_9BACT|nr:diguanylate cyclase [Sulfurospirillum diekertiae]QIR75419.1 diguanylate cyclase [Sulfurospirillum diekertiae]
MRALIFCLFFYITLFANHHREPISLQLTWLHQFQSAGFYVAQEKGFYEDLDLNVTIKEYQKGLNVVDAVLAKKSTYGIGRSSLIIDRSNHKPVVALMALFQYDPSILITTNPTIQTPQDLFNRTIMMSLDKLNSASMISMLLSHGVKVEDIFVQEPSFNIEDLIQHKIDAMACYISNEPFTLSKQNIPYTILNPKEYGFNFYGDILFTSEDELTLHKERAKRFYTATKQGWEWAFEHIPETAQLIYEKYNTQNKSLEALIYEGETLKKLAFDDDKPYGTLEPEKVEAIRNVYKRSGMLQNIHSLEGFIDPLHFAKDIVKIGVLASREDQEIMPKTWSNSEQYLSDLFTSHQFVIIPLSFEEMEKKIQHGDLDFIITNPMFSIQLSQAYGISQIATISPRYKNHFYSEYGSVIFTKADATIERFNDLHEKKIGAVSPRSFGGYLLGMKEIGMPSLEKNILFFGTHANVVKAVLEGRVDAGIIRTDVLENMQEDNLISLSDIKILHAKKYPDFPFLVSTELYPEWVLAKTSHASEYLTNEVLSTLLKFSSKPKNKQEFRLTTPLDNSKVHALMQEFNIYPYQKEPYTFTDALLKYKYFFLGLFIPFIMAIFFIMHIQRLNKKLREHAIEIGNFNATLEHEVEERTHQLTLLNSKLKELANTDELTRIDNRRHFFLLATQYFYSSKRNNLELYIFSLDIDLFKQVNDTYGHAIGDEVLKSFCHTIKEIIRQSDLFGRIGGEEFCICIQNTTLEGATTLAEKIRESIQNTTTIVGTQELPKITVSIGISSIQKGDNEIFDIIKRSDEALYRAKRNGRNQVQIILK